ncbi:protoheme ferro-lyase [Clostridium aceticum]|uniref:Protoheme ferro-lyase n=1 Tax=Clostridium aceticum TaxID=84022 RepID=A0A0D8I9R1_9CLOT|nr:hypothetical protein [Clostridium aceticum]AKL95637.1 protoheme ferro-lyase [Clostridium aceticum]KJF26794.1 hypothetical protein TZ02_11310 [Clostridium aceticum]
MNILIKSFLLTFIFTFALITKGMVERILLSICFVSLGIYFIKNKNNVYKDKTNCKSLLKGIIFSYLIVIILLLYFQYSPKEGYIVTNYVSNTKTAVILVFQGEPTTYNIPLATKNFMQKHSWWKTPILPFALFKEKLSYEKVDVAASVHYNNERLIYQLKEELGGDYNVYAGYSANTPYLIESINQALEEGNQYIIISPVLLTECKDFTAITNQVKQLNLQQYRVEPQMIEALWNSEAIAKSFVKQINDFTTNVHRQNTGIVLIGSEMEESLPHIKQDVLFRERVKDYLIKEGYNNNKIELTFLHKKSIVDAIEGLMVYGVGEIILLSTTTEAYQMHNYLTVEKVLEGLEPPYGVKIHRVNPWKFNDAIVKELSRRILLKNL